MVQYYKLKMQKFWENESDGLTESSHPGCNFTKEGVKKKQWIQFFQQIHELSMIDETDLLIRKLGKEFGIAIRPALYNMPIDMLKQWVDNCTNSGFSNKLFSQKFVDKSTHSYHHEKSNLLHYSNASKKFKSPGNFKIQNLSDIYEAINDKENIPEQKQSFYRKKLGFNTSDELFTSTVCFRKKKLYTAQKFPVDLELFDKPKKELQQSTMQLFKSNKSSQTVHSNKNLQNTEEYCNKNGFLKTETQKTTPVSRRLLLKKKRILLECQVQSHRFKPFEIHTCNYNKPKYKENINVNSIDDDSVLNSDTDVTNYSDGIFDKRIKQLENIDAKENSLLDLEKINQSFTKLYFNKSENWNEASDFDKTHFSKNVLQHDDMNNSLPVRTCINLQILLDEIDKNSKSSNSNCNLLNKNDGKCTNITNMNIKCKSKRCLDSVVSSHVEESVKEKDVTRETRKIPKIKLSKCKENNPNTYLVNKINLNSIKRNGITQITSDLNNRKCEKKRNKIIPILSSESNEKTSQRRSDHLLKYKLNSNNLNVNSSWKKIRKFNRNNLNKCNNYTHSNIINQTNDKNSVISKSSKNEIICYSIHTTSLVTDDVFPMMHQKTNNQNNSNSVMKNKSKNTSNISRKTKQSKPNEIVDLKLFSDSEDSTMGWDFLAFKNKILTSPIMIPGFPYDQ